MSTPNPYPVPGFPAAAAFAWIANASNVKTQTNPAYTVSQFLSFYTQFNGVIEENILTSFITMASSCVSQQRWHDLWEQGMRLFVAHFATLYLQALGDANQDASDVVNNAQGNGLITAESVGDVSASYDYGALIQGIEGWAMWNSTAYGRQYATLARMVGKAGMYIW